MPRCCSPLADEFKPCYASVVVAGTLLKEEVESIEQSPMRSSLTAWCSHCHAQYLITNAVSMFPTPSAHHAHMVAWARTLDK
jgi:cytochrome c553